VWRRYSKTRRLSWRGDLLDFSLFCRAHAQTTQGLRDPLPNRRRQIGREGEKGIDRSKVSQIPEGGDRRFSDRAGSLLKLWQEDLQQSRLLKIAQDIGRASCRGRGEISGVAVSL